MTRSDPEALASDATPAPTSGSEDVFERSCRAALEWFQGEPEWWDTPREFRDMAKAALAKPASEPAGGDVREAAEDLCIAIERDIPSWQSFSVRTHLNRLREALSEAALSSSAGPAVENWQDDPTADERWNAGCDFAMTRLCDYLGVDPSSVRWDAATETVDGDVSAVIGNIFTTRFGEDWSPSAHPAPATVEMRGELVALVGEVELSEDRLSLRRPYDGDVDGDGRHIVVGGEVIATFEDSDAGEAARDLLRAALSSSAGPAVEAVAWRWRFLDDKPSAPWSYTTKIEDVMGIDIQSQPLYAHPAPAAVESEALRALYEWYDRDGSVGAASEVFEQHRAALAPATGEPK